MAMSFAWGGHADADFAFAKFFNGDHTLAFVADGEPTRPSDLIDESKDRRPLAVAFRNENWTVQ